MSEVASARAVRGLGRWYLGDLAGRLAEVLLPSPLQQIGAAGDGQDDAVGHAVVMETEFHGSFEVAGE